MSEELIVLLGLIVALFLGSAAMMMWIVKIDTRQKRLSGRLEFIVAPLARPDEPEERFSLSKSDKKASGLSKLPRISLASILTKPRPIRSNGGWCHR